MAEATATSDTEQKQLLVLADVGVERDLQDEEWGEQNHEPEIWLSILTEEVGELATAMLKARFAQYEHRKVRDMRREAIQVAAVAVAFVEYLDRRVAKEKTL